MDLVVEGEEGMVCQRLEETEREREREGAQYCILVKHSNC